MNSIAQLATGLGMIMGLILIVLGIVLSQNSYLVAEWFGAGRVVSLLGAALLAISAIIYGVFL